MKAGCCGEIDGTIANDSGRAAPPKVEGRGGLRECEREHFCLIFLFRTQEVDLVGPTRRRRSHLGG